MVVAERHEALGQPAEAAAVIRAVLARHAGCAVADDPDQIAWFGAILGTAGRLLRTGGAVTQAVWSADTAVRLFRRIAEERPDDYSRDLARALVNAGLAKAGADDATAALADSAEAVAILRGLRTADPGEYAVLLATALQAFADVRGTVLVTADDLVEAAAALAELVALCRKLEERDPAANAKRVGAARDHAAEFLRVLDSEPGLLRMSESAEVASLRAALAAGLS